jgi:hypothetical protein
MADFLQQMNKEGKDSIPTLEQALQIEVSEHLLKCYLRAMAFIPSYTNPNAPMWTV